MGVGYKARPRSTVKVPDTLPEWKRSLWRKIWRAAFLVLNNETAARRIATHVVNPPAIKPPPDLIIPQDVPANKTNEWIQVARKADGILNNRSLSEQIAYQVTGKAEMETTSVKTSGSGVLIHRAGGLVQAHNAVKAYNAGDFPHESSEEGYVEGYLVSWGNPSDTDLQGEYFTIKTDFCLDWFKERPVLYHHGMDSTAGLQKIGTFKSVKVDELGLWVQAQLDLRDKYARAVYDMVKTKSFGWSSGSVDHLVKISDGGEILVWPLIEGSITPTPAQPAKTTVRAFKALLSGNTDLADYLRGLDARVGEMQNGRSSRNFKNEHTDKNKRFYVGEGVKSIMNRYYTNDSSYYIARAVAKAFGLKGVTEDELKAVADEVAPVVKEEITSVAADELLSGTVQADPLLETPVRSYRSMRRGYRADDPFAVQDDPLLGMQADDPLLGMQADPEAMMMDEIAAQMEDDALETSAARALTRRAWRRAIRQITEGEAAVDAPHMGTPAMDDPIPLAQDTLKGLRRNRRGYRADDPFAVQDDPLLGMQADDPLLGMQADPMVDPLATQADPVTQVAAQAYRSGYRNGMRSAYRQLDDQASIQADEEAANQMEAALASLGDPTAMQADEVDAAARSYRAGYRKGLNRAIRQMENAIEADDPLAIQADAYMAPTSSPTDYAQAPTGYSPVPVGGTDPSTKRFRSVRQLDDAVMGLDDPALMSDDMDADDVAIQGDEFMQAKYYNSRRPQAFRSAGDVNNQTDYWRNRALNAESVEAPGQRAFKSIGRVVDEADRPGAYEHAFKSYLTKGLAALMDGEKYVLMGKGKANWQGASFSFDSATKSVKAYTGGSDASAGFLVPEDWVNELNKNIMTQTTMAGECRTRTTTSDRIVQPNLVTTDARRAHAANVRWPSETPSASTDHRTNEDTYSQIEIPIHVMLLSLAATNSSLEDSTFNLEEEINEAFSEAVATAYDQLIWAGDGQGKLQGIVVNNQVISSPSTGLQTVGGYVATGSADGIITPDTIKKMLFHLPQSYRQRAKFYMNSNTGLEIATLKDGNGNYLVDQRNDGLRDVGIPDRLLGKPIVYNEWASDIASGAFPIILADLSRGYIIGRRVEFSIRRFDDSNYAENDQVLFMGRARLGGQVLQPAAIKVMKVAAS